MSVIEANLHSDFVYYFKVVGVCLLFHEEVEEPESDARVQRRSTPLSEADKEAGRLRRIAIRASGHLS